MLRLSQRQFEVLSALSYTDLLAKLGTPTRNSSRAWPKAKFRPRTGTVCLMCSISKEYLRALTDAANVNGRRISEEFREQLLQAAGVTGEDSPPRNNRGRRARSTERELRDLYIHQSFMDEDRTSRWPTDTRLNLWLLQRNA